MPGNGGLDAPVGLLHVKDLLVRRARTPRWRSSRAPIEHVPESMLIDELLERLRKLRERFGLVVDEHGTVVGLITLEDILEEIVGEIKDEFDPEEREPMREEPEGTVDRRLAADPAGRGAPRRRGRGITAGAVEPASCSSVSGGCPKRARRSRSPASASAVLCGKGRAVSAELRLIDPTSPRARARGARPRSRGPAGGWRLPAGSGKCRSTTPSFTAAAPHRGKRQRPARTDLAGLQAQ